MREPLKALKALKALIAQIRGRHRQEGFCLNERRSG
jgi:hypothetical protein